MKYIFTILFFLLLNATGFSQDICKDTNCIAFKDAIEYEKITDDYSGYYFTRYKEVKPYSKYLINLYSNNENAMDVINPDKTKNTREIENFKPGQINLITLLNKGKGVLEYSFHNNGNIKSLKYASGSADSRKLMSQYFRPLIFYYKNGNIETLNYFNNDNERVLTITYYPDQTIRNKASFAKGQYNGTIMSYFPNGKIEKIGMANNDLMDGYLLTYNENGSLIKTEFYKNNFIDTLTDISKYKSQLFILKLLAEEENKNIDRSKELVLSSQELVKTLTIKQQKEDELRQKEVELELLSKNKAISDLTIKENENEILKAALIAEQKRKELERLAKENIINELHLKNKEAELKEKTTEAQVNNVKIETLNKENKLKRLESRQKQVELGKQKLIKNVFIIGFFLLGILIFLVYRSLQQNKKSNKIISLQKIEVEVQKHLVEEKQKEIIDSISYAKRLQEAILPPKEFVNAHLENNFIYYQPKDIVAGDFYWAEKIDNMFFIAAADSTGHGVPGAMVSVVCSNALNRSIKEFQLTDTGKILDKTRELVIETFERSANEVKDGMDISLLCIDSENKNIFWSGANNPLWYIQNNELKVIKADKQPIGKTDNLKPFTTHQLEYEEKTTFYLFTDGLADQFGGPKGKKFKYKQFSDLLIKNNNLPQKEQINIISKTFSDWKGDLEQIDDVCIIGIRL